MGYYRELAYFDEFSVTTVHEDLIKAADDASEPEESSEPDPEPDPKLDSEPEPDSDPKPDSNPKTGTAAPIVFVFVTFAAAAAVISRRKN